LITVRLAPLISEDTLRERNTASWLKPAHRVADRQQGIRVDAGRQTEPSYASFLELRVQRGYLLDEAERTR
jgi:hypothetical protein